VQTVTPYLLYEDAGAALDGSRVFLGGPGGDYRNPKRAGRTSLVYVYVEDVD
jgi:hypothetical protein